MSSYHFHSQSLRSKKPFLDRCNQIFGSRWTTALLFQKFRNLIGDEVSKALLSFLNDEASLGDLNHTFIVLISKVKSAEFIT